MKKFLILFTAVFMILTRSAFADYLIVPVEGVIDGGLAAFIERAVKEAQDKKMDGVIFRVNTPGGRIDSAVFIKDTILNAGIQTVAFVDKSAISAGSLISIACDSIYMATGSSIGAATAVDMEGKKASEKVISYFRAQMRATAEAKHRRPDIAEAMVDEQLEVSGINKKGQLITFTYVEALRAGYSNGTVDNIEGVVKALGKPGAKAVEFRLNWTEYVVRFLTNPIVSSLLISIGFLGLLAELKAPGWGVGGTIAVIALALFFGSHYIVKLAGLGEIILLIAGIVLVTLEIFVIPGFGVAGVAGIALILASLFLSLIGSLPSSGDLFRASYTVGGSLIITAAAGYFVIRSFHKGFFLNKIALSTVENAKEGYTSASDYSTLTNKKGIAVSTLRPAGIAEIEGKRRDVVTQGEYIEKGTEIIVIEIEGSRIVVREADKQ